MGHWTDRQLAKITPPQVRDQRGNAILSGMNAQIGARPLSDFFMRDPETCPAEILPALIAEWSMEEFIDPDLPEHVQRRILKNAFLLQSSEGYDDGVKLGLNLLGMTGHIEQWWQVDPKRAPNTHRVYFYVGEELFPNEAAYLSQRTTRAALRMIDATKRLSQGTEVFVGARLKLPVVRSTSRIGVGLSLTRARMRLGQNTPRVRVALTSRPPVAHSGAITARRLSLGLQTPVIKMRLQSAATVKATPMSGHRLTLKGGK